MENAINKFYNDYHRKVQSKPNLYLHNNNQLTVTLPASLLEYSNAAAGHSGFRSGARPVGIRIATDNPKQSRDNIFSSVESLTAFIESSEKDGMALVETLKQQPKKKQPKPTLLNKSVEDYGREAFGKTVFMDQAKKFGKAIVKNDMKLLTVGEFGLRYGLEIA